MSDLDYLESERVKLWETVRTLEEKVEMFQKQTPEHLKDATQASKKTAEFRNKAERRLNEAIKITEKCQEYSNDIDTIKEEVKVKSRTISGINTKATKILTEVQETHSTINDKVQRISKATKTLEELYENYDTFVEQVNELEELYETSTTTSSKLNTLHKSAINHHNNIRKLYYEINGYTDTDEETDEETKVAGLKDELENIYDELSNNISELQDVYDKKRITLNEDLAAFKEDTQDNIEELIGQWKERYNHSLNEVNSLLPKALTAGLSSAYSEKKKAEDIERNKHQASFRTSIITMFICGILPFIISVIFLYNGKTIEEVVTDLPRIVLAILPLYIPIFWIAHSASKKVRLSKRLIEEYSHKEALSKTFEGLSKQIENIEDSTVANNLKTRLLYNILEVNSENPGKLISDYNKSDHPLMEALDQSTKLANIVEKLTNVPGLNHLANILDRKANRLIDNSAEKVAKGLDIATQRPDEDE